MFKLDSQQLAKCIDKYCRANDITKKEFHKVSLISSATLTQWRQGTVVSQKSVERLEEFTGMPVEEFVERFDPDRKYDEDDTFDVRQLMRERPEMKILYHAAKDIPTSLILETAAGLMRYKEESKNK